MNHLIIHLKFGKITFNYFLLSYLLEGISIKKYIFQFITFVIYKR